MEGQRVLMAVFAHPDDEAFGTGGTLAGYAAEGAEVYLVTATRGEAGQIAEPDLATVANLPQVRERELRCACRAYGIHEPILMDYLDGQLTIVHQGQAVGRLVEAIRRIRPQVLVTFGPDGVYGHYDHMAVHRWATAAYELAADPDCFPEQATGACQPHQVAKLYYRVLPQEQVEAMVAAGERGAVLMDGVPFPFVGYRADEITTVIDVSAHVEAKLAGIRCHATQIGRQNRWVDDPAVVETPWFRQEHYVLARSRVGWPTQVEDDLFATYA